MRNIKQSKIINYENTIPTESIGSVPRSVGLQNAMSLYSEGRITSGELNTCIDQAVSDTIKKYEDVGSPVVCDGEQSKSGFLTYPLDGLANIASDGMILPFEDGHTRQLPRLIKGPFKYARYAGEYVQRAVKFTDKPIKQAVISASAMSLLYPESGIANYSKEAFINNLINESVKDIRSCLDNGAYHVQIDFTEGRLAVKLDPSKKLLQEFVDINNRVLSHFSDEERQRIGIHTCPGGDKDSTHSADVDYSELIPLLLTVNAGSFYIQLASEENPDKTLQIISEHLRPNQRIYVGVIDVTNEKVETVEEVCNRVLTAARYIPLDQLGTTDDCGFAPFSDDLSTSRETAFAKIAARVQGTKMAYKKLRFTKDK